jgi:phycocyanin beta chain
MLDAFTKVVAQADAQGTFASNSQIDALKAMVADGTKRIDVVNRIASNSSAIVANAARVLFYDQPNSIAPGGNAYTNRRMAAVTRPVKPIPTSITRSTH